MPQRPRQMVASPALSAPYGGTAAPATTMSSREIAELVEVRHDSVKRTIQTLAGRGVITLPQFVEVSNPGPGPKTIGAYHLGKRDSFVVVAQLSPEFTGRVVDRWQELEEQVAKPPQPPVAASNDPLDLLMVQAQMFPRLIAEMQEQRPIRPSPESHKPLDSLHFI